MTVALLTLYNCICNLTYPTLINLFRWCFEKTYDFDFTKLPGEEPKKVNSVQILL